MDIKQIRKDLHQIPELGRKEYSTKEYILKELKKLNCEIFTPTETGVVAYFNANKERTICFRADMDALEIKEETGLSFCSKNEGFMHACGHDGHMAMLLGFANFASNNLELLKANVVCLFQPSEEDKAGAIDIINSKILDRLRVEEIYGIHIWPNLEAGKLFTKPGGLLATSAEVNIEFKGEGVHAANRDYGVDALMLGAKFMLDFYNFCDSIKEPHLISFGKFNSGKVRNSVADFSRLEATMRAFDDKTFNYMADELKALTIKYENDSNIKIELAINDLYKSVINDSKLITKYQDKLNLNILTDSFMQAEDFGCYTRIYKSMFLLLGCGNKHLLHTSKFDFDMDILKTGVEAYKIIATK